MQKVKKIPQRQCVGCREYKTIIFLSFSVKRIFLAFYTASTV